MTTVLLFVHTNTWFTEMLRVAKLLRDSGVYEPLVHFAYRYPTLQKDINVLEVENIKYSLAPQNFYQIRQNVKTKSTKFLLTGIWGLSLFSKIISKILGKKFNSFPNILNYVQANISDIMYYKDLIRFRKAKLTILAGDLVGYNTAEIAKASAKLNVPCIIVPSTMSDGTEQAEAYFFDEQFGTRRIVNRIAGYLWPRWKRNHKNKTLLRLPGEQVIAKEILKLAPPLPWVSSSSIADAVAVESYAMNDYYTRCGIIKDKLSIAGSLANDEMARIHNSFSSERQMLAEELGFDSGKKLFLTALPPDFLYMPGGRPECEFSDYRSLTMYWMDSFRNLANTNTVISLHPSVNIDDFRYLESDYIKISTRSIVHLLPLCDAFVASVSCTIRWAITCSKPVVNYDVYKYRYSDFMNTSGVIYVDQKQTFREVLNKIATDEKYFCDLKEIVKIDAPYWGNLDGKEGSRLLDLFECAIHKKMELKYEPRA